MGQHHLEQRVGGDVERHAQEHVGGALVELQVQAPVRDAHLPERVAGRQRLARHIRGVPGRHDKAAAVGCGFDHLDKLRDLVDRFVEKERLLRGAQIGGHGTGKGAPLVSVDRPQVAVLIRPFVPDGDAVFLEVADVGVAGQEPQQFMDDGAQVQFLGRDQRKAVGQPVA